MSRDEQRYNLGELGEGYLWDAWASCCEDGCPWAAVSGKRYGRGALLDVEVRAGEHTRRSGHRTTSVLDRWRDDLAGRGTPAAGAEPVGVDPRAGSTPGGDALMARLTQPDGGGGSMPVPRAGVEPARETAD